MPEVDNTFPRAWPFGVLKTIQWASPLATLITIYLGPYIYPSVNFVLFSSWFFFLQSFVTWLCYLFGFQHSVRPQEAGANARAYVYIPFALIDFVAAIVATGCFGICALICVICMIDGFAYRAGVVLTYFFATVFCLIAGGAFGYFAILIKRDCPNGNLSNLKTMVIEGTRTTSISINGQTPMQTHVNIGGPTSILTR
ncbi:hypothetical protein Ddc_11047 [Ditylenchus destructor]|nr:hypothetical protein Ddc_11047 [Ditylenchus destructor]